MRLLFPNRFIPLVLIAALAITAASAAPVHADDRRTARTVATLLGLAVVGKIIYDKHKDDKEEKRARKVQKVARDYHAPPPRQHVEPVHRHGNIRHSHRDGSYAHDHGYNRHQPRPLPSRIDRKQLPKHCFYNIQTRKGSAQLFERSCLERTYRHVDRMPRSCAQRVRTRDGILSGFDARCLRDNGYSLARG